MAITPFVCSHYSRALTGAWIETSSVIYLRDVLRRRALTGAWIETVAGQAPIEMQSAVAPSRARGLKLLVVLIRVHHHQSRPHGRVD